MLKTWVSKPILPMLHRRCMELGSGNSITCKINTLAAKSAKKVERIVNNIHKTFDIDDLKYPAIVSVSKPGLLETGASSPSLEQVPYEMPNVNVPGHATKKMFREFAEHVTWDDAQGFLDTLPSVMNDIIGSQPQFKVQVQSSSTTPLADRFRRIVDYNLTPFTQFGAMQTLAVNSFYNDKCGLSCDSLPYNNNNNNNVNKSAYHLGWCSELMYSQFLILDDLVDGSSKRFGQSCWHLTPLNFAQSTQGQENRASAALYDVLLLQNAAHALLKIYFGAHKSCGPALENLFFYVMNSNHGGMALEVEENSKFFNSGRLCSMETYLDFRGVQNGLILSYFPIAATAILHGVGRPEILKEMESACVDIFLFFAITRDYVDCYTDVSYMGNDGTDIQNGRVTWLLISAMERASPLQQKLLQENVGKSSRESVERVLELYTELKLPGLLKNWQIQFYENTVKKIENLSPELPRDYLRALLNIFNKHLSH